MVSRQFRDKRTGAIVTQVPLSQIQYFEELRRYEFTFRARPAGALGVFDQRVTVTLDAAASEPLLSVVERAGDAAHLAAPASEFLGIARATCDHVQIVGGA
jgi:hypothetical protein